MQKQQRALKKGNAAPTLTLCNALLRRNRHKGQERARDIKARKPEGRCWLCTTDPRGLLSENKHSVEQVAMCPGILRGSPKKLGEQDAAAAIAESIGCRGRSGASPDLVQLPGADSSGSPAAAFGSPLTLLDEGTPLVDLEGGPPGEGGGVWVESRDSMRSRGLAGEFCRSRTKGVS